MDVHEDTKSNVVAATFELPGLSKENVNIDVHNNVLVVSGESKISSDREENGYAVRERRFGKFSRSIPLPQGIKVGCAIQRDFRSFSGTNSLSCCVSQTEEIKANMENGVLTVTFPKTAPEMAPKKINIV